MQWAKPTHTSKGEIDRAGDILISDTATEEEKNKAFDMLNNWRAIHSYPMHVFKVGLKRNALLVDKSALTAQRLKRVPSIVNKLKRPYGGRPPTMKLSQMQDIAGCRAVLATVPQVKKLCQDYIKGNLKHPRAGVKDYISRPKEDGYRSIHIVYKFFSDKGKKIYNNLLVELQFRSKLQHYWATAIETVDFFTRQAIKSNEGQPEWMDFFKLVSSAFAIMEDCPPVPNITTDENELYLQIKKKEAELKVIKIMTGWANAMKVFDEFTGRKKTKAQFFLLELDIIGEKMTITAYTKKQEQRAIENYARAEKRNKDKKEYDVVLVGVDTVTDLRKAYPNYFVDSKEFLENLRKIIAKAK